PHCARQQPAVVQREWNADRYDTMSQWAGPFLTEPTAFDRSVDQTEYPRCLIPLVLRQSLRHDEHPTPLADHPGPKFRRYLLAYWPMSTGQCDATQFR